MFAKAKDSLPRGKDVGVADTVNAAHNKPAFVPRGRRLIAVASWVYLLIVLLAWGCLYLGDLWWPFTWLLFSPRWLFIVPICFLTLPAALWRRQSLPILFVALLLVLGPVMDFAWYVPRSDLPADGLRIRVLTCNMHYLHPNSDIWHRLFVEQGPDIVAVQELRGEEEHLPKLPEQWHLHQEPGLYLASRFPIEAKLRLGDESMEQKGSVMRYRLQTPAGPVTIFSVHLASPRDGLYQLLHHPSAGIEELNANSSLREQQLQRLANWADEVPDPVVLVGDFNTPRESCIFRHYLGKYSDAFTEAGCGWGYTFIGAKTTVRIDHILLGSGWRCQHAWIGPDVGSPHLPVVADLIWNIPQP